MVGTLQNLHITRLSPYGAFLQGNNAEILLPKKFVDSAMCVGDSVRVFVAFDSEDRIVATTQIPKLLLGEQFVQPSLHEANHSLKILEVFDL